MTEQFANFAQSSLSSNITAKQTTINVADASTFPLLGNFRIVVQSFDVTTQIPTSAPELMLVTAVSGKQFTVTRGIENTIASAFASGAQVTHILTAAVMASFGTGGGGGSYTTITGVPSDTLLGNNTGSTANAIALTVAQVNTLLGLSTTYVPYNGATGNVNLGAYNIEAAEVQTNVLLGHIDGLAYLIDATIGGQQVVVLGDTSNNYGNNTIVISDQFYFNNIGNNVVTIDTSGNTTAANYFLNSANLGGQTTGMVYDFPGNPTMEFGINMFQFANYGQPWDSTISGGGIRVDNRGNYGIVSVLYQDPNFGTGDNEVVPFTVANPFYSAPGTMPWVLIGEQIGNDGSDQSGTGYNENLQVYQNAVIGYGNVQRVGPFSGGTLGVNVSPINYAVDIYDANATGYDIGNSTIGSWSIDNQGNFQTSGALATSGAGGGILYLGGIGSSVNISQSTGDMYINWNYSLTLSGDSINLDTALCNSFGSTVIDSSGIFYYPSGASLTDGSNRLFYSNGQVITDGSQLYYPTGQGMTFSGNDLNFYGVLTQNGNIYVNSSGVLFAPLGCALTGVTNGLNPNAGIIGEYLSSSVPNTNFTATISIAAPAVITKTAHGLNNITPVVFTTTGALPTGITASTVYWTCNVAANTFNIATSIANAIANTKITTTGTQSGTQTVTVGMPLSTGSPLSVTALSLTAGDWDVGGNVAFTSGALTTSTAFQAAIGSGLNALPTSPGAGALAQIGVSVSAGGVDPIMPTGTTRVSVSSTTTYYLEAQSTFATSTSMATGFMWARRAR